MKRQHLMPFGATLQPGKGVVFRFWAPARERVDLELLRGDSAAALQLVETIPMRNLGQGWHEAFAAGAGAGQLYRFRIDPGLAVPDPASRFNPFGVHGPSEVVDPRAYPWRHSRWRGRRWEEAVLYELHPGCFTAEGSFAAAAERFAELARLGVTGVELMPVAAFPGTRNWGYDGVLPYAPAACYGRPEELKRLVDTAHAHGLMVLLDVVYNHFGPDGNYLGSYAPQFFDESRHTPWGAAIDFDGPSSGPVRDFFVHNALYWVEEYGFDGLRLDAVHAIEDRSSPDLVESIAQALRDGPGAARAVHLVLENDRNEVRYLERHVDGRRGLQPRHATAQWNDDFHHVLHLLLTGETDGYYADYADEPVAKLGRALAEGFVFQGEASAFRGGERRGAPSAHLPPAAFVSCLQTHDQVGNRAFGERLDAIADGGLMPAAIACLLLGPQVPMLFMGEEYAASTPFLFFCDFEGGLAEAVREGRRDEFGRFAAFRDPAARATIADPNALSTFEASRLRWDERELSPHRERLALVQRLLAARHALIRRFGVVEHGGKWVVVGDALSVRWALGADAGDAPASGGGADTPEAAAALVLAIRVNFGAGPVEVVPQGKAELVFSHAAAPGMQADGWRLGRGGIVVTVETAPESPHG